MIFLHPEFLWLWLLLPLPWFLPRRAKDRVQASLRSLALALVVVALARPVNLGDSAPTHDVVILDRSASVHVDSNRDSLMEAFAESREQRRRDGEVKVKSHLIVVGAGPDVSVDAAEFDERQFLRHGSDLGRALRLAQLAIPEGSSGRLTLISDGLGTSHDWGRAGQEISARGLRLNTLRRPGMVGDLRVVAAEFEEELRVGQSTRLNVDVIGAGQTAFLRVLLDGVLVAESVPFSASGRHTQVVEFEPALAGFFALDVEVVLADGEDSFETNNVLSRPVAVQDPRSILYLGQRVRGGAKTLGDLLGSSFKVDDADQGKLGTKATTDFSAYDLVVLDDRPATTLSDTQQRSLVSAVQNQGTGLLVSGGSASFGPGGYHRTALSEVLPVESVQKEEKKDPSTALAVIIDTSGSMAGQRIVLAKEVTRLAIRRLLPHDKVGIVEFYGAKRWAAPLQSAANAINIQRALNRLDAGGGTVILPAIEEAFYGMKNVQTRYKHVLILTDGGVETGAFEPLLRSMAKDGVTVSTVLVGPGRHSDFLVQLADWGKGRFYHASDRFNLPEVILKQPSTSHLPAYRPGRHAVKAKGGTGWWGDVDPRAVPDLSGYVETKLRPGARLLLETARESHPILATWRHGLGRVTAMTTEPSGPGTASWRDWSGYGPFLARVLERSAATDLGSHRFRLERRRDRVFLYAERREATAPAPKAWRCDAAGQLGEAFEFSQLTAGIWRAETVVDPQEPVFVMAAARRQAEGRGRNVLATIRIVDAPASDQTPELMVDPSRALDLEAIARLTGGFAAAADPSNVSDLVWSKGSAPLRVEPIWPWFLLLSLLVYLADIAWRRRANRPAAE
ncbi:MAG: VWA domain-containing protein [Planctomycetota bacterium]